MLKLCGACNGRNGGVFETAANDSGCFICRGACASLQPIAAAAIRGDEKQFRRFSVRTSIPDRMLAREEEAWDVFCGESVKSGINRALSTKIAGDTGLEYSPQWPDVIYTFSFSEEGKCAASSAIADQFFFGRYYKSSREMAQSAWDCPSCRGRGCAKCNRTGKKHDSIEENVCIPAAEFLGAASAEMHSSGREDVDVTNTAGRPFVLAVHKPKKFIASAKDLESAVNSPGKGVRIVLFKQVPPSWVSMVSDSHFDKAYVAEIECACDAKKAEAGVLSLSGAMLEQRTPLRVAMRRADLVRKRRILELSVLSSSPLRVRIKAEAGTYIKEFISGDGGRTNPSVSGVLGCDAKCINLEVEKIDDSFLGDMLGMV
jgi:tRNA pseudouridine synthase 10